MITRSFANFLDTFLSNSIKYIVLRAVWGALNITLLRVRLFKVHSQIILSNEGKN